MTIIIAAIAVYLLPPLPAVAFAVFFAVAFAVAIITATAVSFGAAFS
jgi:hypothetical protein